jgi:hypothetical protein
MAGREEHEEAVVAAKGHLAAIIMLLYVASRMFPRSGLLV